MDTTRRDALAALAGVGLASTAGCLASAFVERKQKTVTGTIDPGDAAATTVRNPLGDVTVKSESRSDVRYRAHMHSSIEEKNFDEMSVEGRRDGDTLAVEAVHREDGTTTPRDPKLGLTLWVPASLSVTAVDVDSGDVTATGTTGDLTVRAGSGDVQVRDVDGDVDARLDSGDLDVRHVSGDVTAAADSGDVTVRYVDGFAGGGVDSGDAEFTDVGGLTDASAGSGDLTVEVPELREDTRVTVGSGDLTARLGADLDAEVLATAGSGDVSVDGLGLSSGEDYAEGTLGDGTHELRIEAGSGDVALRSL